MKAGILTTLTILLILTACTAVGERTLVSVGYYNVSGDTFTELDRDIRLHGPNVTGVGKALASTDLKMVPKISYARKQNRCEVSDARINVQARVTLPRHVNEKKLKRELASAWSNLSEYARVHEAVHLAIADRYALVMEEAIEAIEPKADCQTLREEVQAEFSRLFKLHHQEQLKFDEDEKARIRMLIAESRKS